MIIGYWLNFHYQNLNHHLRMIHLNLRRNLQMNYLIQSQCLNFQL